ncbi:prepilin-type N-terminal cleavage/methylation domain-containing protein [Psychrobacillus sp. BL-248-WT-3]|uniref:type IV pilus modification PilV family protein n=1 Tax=Psychrobacillus sp. BL-248-WT-3 TaxID=2725306 RepID=UPI00146CA6BF|nr:prepilin-type N-terminal cleavage/methylation domain-containing protein [Psychrobacillus sp. BL-248-WT-3]NME06161.1 prepilin-type N-terminal cleavage/methylation domain-containing protein [Psychrobacillus sp. BL-248-WT-3]
MVNQKGLTLVEVLTSLAIISIVLLSFFQLIINSNENAASNNEKLVMIYLADAELERLKIDPSNLFLVDLENSTFEIKEKLEKVIKLNNKNYKVSIKTSQNNDEKKMKLLNVVIKVRLDSSKSSSAVEGYIVYE